MNTQNVQQPNNEATRVLDTPKMLKRAPMLQDRVAVFFQKI